MGTWEPNEQGAYGDHKGKYMRKQWDGEDIESPFTSIPQALWLVVVTVTTVGYGDIAPTTNMGRLVGALTIIGGIVGFAMPMGVISSNFDRVWQEKEEKKEEEKKRQVKEMSLIASALRGNRLAELRVVVQDDDGLGSRPEFLGECYIGLNTLGWTASKPGGASLTCKLQDNAELAERTVTGTINVHLLYQPDGNGKLSKIEEEKLMYNNHRFLDGTKNQGNAWENPPVPSFRGGLTVYVQSAENLLNVDSGLGGASDPFCRVMLFPDQKEIEAWETKVVKDSLCPTWGEQKSFVLDWTNIPDAEEDTRTSSNISDFNDFTDEDCSPEVMNQKVVARMEMERDFWKARYESLLS